MALNFPANPSTGDLHNASNGLQYHFDGVKWVSQGAYNASTINTLNFTQQGTGAVSRSVQNKLEEVVSVKDFGAKGDGTTDDTTAIQAAFNSISNFSSVYFPTGTYLLSANITATNKKAILNGATFTGGFDIDSDVIESFEQFLNKKGSNLAVGTPAIGTEFDKGGILIGAGHSNNNTGSWISCDGASNWLSVLPNKLYNPQELIVYNSGLNGYAATVVGTAFIDKTAGTNFPAPYDSTNELIGDQFYFLRKVFKIKAVVSATRLELEEEDKSAVTFPSPSETEAYTYLLTTGTGTATVTGTSLKYVSGDPFVSSHFNRGFKLSLTGVVTEFNIPQANITEANPAVFTFNGHGLQNGDTLKYTTNGTQPLVTSAGTTIENNFSNATVFHVVNRTDNTFQLAATSGGAGLQVTNDGSDGQIFSINVTFVDPSEYTLGSAVGNGTYNFKWKGNTNDQLSTLRVQAINGADEENVNLIAYGGNNSLSRYYALEAGLAGTNGKFRPIYIGSGNYTNLTYAHQIGCYPRDAKETNSSRPMLALGGVQGRESLIVRGVANGVAHANRLEVEGSAASAAPSILASGSDTNINIALTPKGTGQVSTTKLEVTSATNTPTFLANGEVDNPQYPAYGFTGQNAGNGARGAGMYLAGDGFLAFSTHGISCLQIDAGGRLLFGTTTANGAGGITFIPDNDDNAATMVFNRANTTNTSFIQSFQNAGTSVGYIAYTNTTTTFGTSSDYRLKENVTAISDGITRLKTLKPSRFNFKADKNKTVDGFLAHEVTAVPEAVTGTKDGMKDILYAAGDTIPSDKKVGDVKETVPDYQGIDQSKLVPLLTAALQEAIAKIEVLETKVAALEGA